MVRQASLLILSFTLLVGVNGAFAQEKPRHIEIRIINPTPAQPTETRESKHESPPPAPTQSVTSTQPADISQIIKQSRPAVVTIVSGNKQGSGFIVSREGLVLTNAHVIENQAPLILLADGSKVTAAVRRTDAEKDLALLQAAWGRDYPFLPLGDSDKVVQGHPVITIGSPVGLEGTVTQGIVSAVRRGPHDLTLIQIDAAINQGNSGGPLLNKEGQVIGINTAKYNQPNAERLGFAISINDAKKFVAR